MDERVTDGPNWFPFPITCPSAFQRRKRGSVRYTSPDQHCHPGGHGQDHFNCTHFPYIWPYPLLKKKLNSRHHYNSESLFCYMRNRNDTDFKDFPGGPVAKTSSSQSRGPGFNTWSGN